MTTEGSARTVEDIFRDALKARPIKMTEEEGEKRQEKSASELFKDIFTPKKPTAEVAAAEALEPRLPDAEAMTLAKEVEEKLEEKGMHLPPTLEERKIEPEPPKQGANKPSSELFKDIFKVEDTLDASPEKKPAPEPPAPASAAVADDRTYDRAVEKIIKSTVEGRGILGEFRLIEKEGKAELMLNEGEIEIPLGARVEVVKRGGEIAIIVKKGGGGSSSAEDLEKAFGGQKKPEGESDEDILGDLEDMEESSPEEEKRGGTLMSDVKNELELSDLRKEFKQEKKEKEEEEEENKEEEESEPGFLAKIMGRLRKTTEESKGDKLKRMSLENLSKMREIGDERKAIVGVAYVLKEFLEIKYEIGHELTYMELIKELRTREMNNELRSRLITFFKRTTLMLYANKPPMDSFSKAHSLAERTIKELS